MFINSATTTNYNERQIRLLEYLENRVKAGKTFNRYKETLFQAHIRVNLPTAVVIRIVKADEAGGLEAIQ